jgi:hypothetical protein
VGISLTVTDVSRIDKITGPHGTTRIPDLDGMINSALRQDRWPGMSQYRFDALRQSLLFASNLLHLSSAALASFFPNVVEHPQRNVGQAVRRRIIAGPIDDNKEFTQETYEPMAVAMKYFDSLASSITWVESPKILSKNSWFGISGSGKTEPEHEDNEWDWAAAEERDDDAGRTTRQVTIAIASEFVDAILTSKPDSEQHLFPTFYAGITIAHELAHFWALHRYTTVPSPAFGEPLFGNHLDMELGDAYISWLFGGFIPHPIGDGADEGDFRRGMQWQRAHEVGMTDSGYDIRYSMKISDIERMLSHDEWITQLKGNNPGAARLALLHPEVPFRINDTARTVKWRRYDLSGSGLGFDVRGLAKEGDERFVDYSLCPLGFCDLDWDDVAKIDSFESAANPGQVLESSDDGGKTSTKDLEQQEKPPQTPLGRSEEDTRSLDLKSAPEENALNEIGERLQKDKDKTNVEGASKRVRMEEHVESTDDDGHDNQPKENPTPLSAAACHFFQHDMPAEQRKKLESELRVFNEENPVNLYPKKNVLANNMFDFDSDDDLMLAMELNADGPYDHVKIGDMGLGHQTPRKKWSLLCMMDSAIDSTSKKAKAAEHSAE